MYQTLQTAIWEAARALGGFCEKLDGSARLIDAYCKIGKHWQKVAPQAEEKEVQRTFVLLLQVKERLGGCHFELMADLINVGRRLRDEKEETAESLRSLWRREASSRKNTAHLGNIGIGHLGTKKSSD